MRTEQVIKRPLIFTEKGSQLRDRENKYFFEVDLHSSKTDIKQAIEEVFKVTVTNVATMVMRGKTRRMGRGHAKRHNWKKAIVAVKQGETIDPLEGV